MSRDIWRHHTVWNLRNFTLSMFIQKFREINFFTNDNAKIDFTKLFQDSKFCYWWFSKVDENRQPWQMDYFNRNKKAIMYLLYLRKKVMDIVVYFSQYLPFGKRICPLTLLSIFQNLPSKHLKIHWLKVKLIQKIFGLTFTIGIGWVF